MSAGGSARNSKSDAVAAFANSASRCAAVRAVNAALNAKNEECDARIGMSLCGATSSVRVYTATEDAPTPC
jgi:hypothetical protein